MYNLLIVDDEYEICNGLCNLFPWDEIGFSVIGNAGDGQQALDIIDHNKIDVILSDICMPTFDGLQMAKKLYEEKRNIKIVFLSGYSNFDYAQKAIKYGVMDYILKPTKYYELKETFIKIKESLDKQEAMLTAAQQDETNLKKTQAVSNSVIQMIRNYVEYNYADASLEGAAELLNMNFQYVSKVFKSKTGQNFSDYLLQVKMEKASVLLNDFRYKVYEVSEMVGYTNPKNFARAFRAYFGKGPQKYRADLESEQR